MSRTELINRVWELVVSTIDGYSGLIQKLLDTLTDSQLLDLVDDLDCDRHPSDTDFY